MMAKPYTSGELMRLAIAIGGPQPLDPLRVLATYANPDNWKQVIGHDERGPRNYWAWAGPTIVGYELAGWGVKASNGPGAAS